MKARYIISAVGIVVAGAIAWRIYANAGPADSHSRFGPPAALTVATISVGKQDVPLVFSANGRAQTRHDVTVRARVGGILKKVLFTEGDRVKAGQLLFVIDPKPYQVQVAQAKAKVEQAEAQLATDSASAKRMSKLIGKSYVSRQDYQNAKATVKQDKATLAADKASLDQAKMQLSYTRIKAPISGRTGAITYKAGNLIDANGTTALVTINQLSPIEVQFDVPQNKLPLLLHHKGSSELKVAVADATGNTIAENGKLVFIDNTVNNNTGTLGVKALFPNKRRLIWPGELVTVNLTLKVENNALVVPLVAVQPGQNGSYVYTVSDGKVKIRNVAVQRHYQGLAVIGKGLQAGDSVIVRVPRQLHAGMKVKTHRMTLSEAVPKLDLNAT